MSYEKAKAILNSLYGTMRGSTPLSSKKTYTVQNVAKNTPYVDTDSVRSIEEVTMKFSGGFTVSEERK